MRTPAGDWEQIGTLDASPRAESIDRRHRERTVHHDEHELDPGDWFACDFPERPFEQGQTVFLSDCYPCRLALRSAVVNGYAEVERCAHARELRTLAELSAAWGTL